MVQAHSCRRFGGPQTIVEAVVNVDELVALAEECADLGADLALDPRHAAALPRILELGVKHIHGCDWVSVTEMYSGRPRTLAASHPLAERIDAAQFGLGDAPCLRAMTSRVQCLVPDLYRGSRWPGLQAAVSRRGDVASMLSVRLPGAAAALNLSAAQPGAFTDHALPAAAALAAHTANLLAIRDVAVRAVNLQSALESNRRIGTAIGVLMARHKITSDAAFAFLRTLSQHSHRKLHAVAEDVIDTGELPALGPVGR
jgi:hypothetical protein